MSTQEAPVDRLRRAGDAFGSIVAGVRPDEWTLPTPCDQWDVRGLVAHVVAGTALFARMIEGQPLPTGEALAALRPTDFVGDDAASSFATASAALTDALGRPGVMEEMFDAPVGRVPGAVVIHLRVTELLVHGWDLARALGRGHELLPEDLAVDELAFSQAAMQQLPPGRTPFAPPRPVADDAPAVDRLAALLGRGVTG